VKPNDTKKKTREYEPKPHLSEIQNQILKKLYDNGKKMHVARLRMMILKAK